MTTSITVNDTVISIDPMLIFQRIAISTHTHEDLQQYLLYELAPYPLSLFDEAGMRTGTKSAFYDAFDSVDPLQLQLGALPYYVLDGGFLLHKVKWDKHMTIEQICQRYVSYLQKYYESLKTAIVFDEYSPDDNHSNTKATERLRRSRKYLSASIPFDRSTSIPVTQDVFLSNDKNKCLFIQILSEELLKAEFEVQQAFEDADRLIVETACDRSYSYSSVSIVGEVVDLLVLMTALGRAEWHMYLKKPAHGTNPKRIFSCESFKHEVVKPFVLFPHAFSGCDTTSAIYFQGKSKLVGLLRKDEKLRAAAENFNKPHNHSEAVEGAGRAMFVALYGGLNCKNTLADLRFKKFIQSAVKSKSNPSSLPPSPEAANQHSRRVYYQVQLWLGNSLDPLEWGWRETPRGLQAIPTTNKAAPDSLMKLITCGCKGNCGAACGCRKAGILCSVACRHCGGENCTNILSPNVDEMHAEETEELSLGSNETWDKKESSEEDNSDPEPEKKRSKH